MPENVLTKSQLRFLVGKDGLCSQAVQSQKCLVTKCHTDSDLSKCISLWTTACEPNNNIEGWHFLLPKVRFCIDNKSYFGVAIEIKNGVEIDLDDRNIFHYSTAPLDSTMNVHGSFMLKNSLLYLAVVHMVVLIHCG